MKWLQNAMLGWDLNKFILEKNSGLEIKENA